MFVCGMWCVWYVVCVVCGVCGMSKNMITGIKRPEWIYKHAVSDISFSIERGELTKDTDRQLILDMFIAPLYWHVIVQHRPVRSADIRRFSGLVLIVSK